MVKNNLKTFSNSGYFGYSQCWRGLRLVTYLVTTCQKQPFLVTKRYLFWYERTNLAFFANDAFTAPPLVAIVKAMQ